MGDDQPESEGEEGEGRRKLVDESLACRYLAAQCLVSCIPSLCRDDAQMIQVHQEKYHEALELLGESSPFREQGISTSLISRQQR
jgi:anaphase-promoting complex subunit 6